jgi:hypothetical protein
MDVGLSPEIGPFVYYVEFDESGKIRPEDFGESKKIGGLIEKAGKRSAREIKDKRKWMFQWMVSEESTFLLDPSSGRPCGPS